MADEVERLVYDLSADIRKFERSWEKATQKSAVEMQRIERRYDRMNSRIQASTLNTADMLKTAIATIGVTAAIRETIDYADAWTQAENKLLAAGVAQDRLNQRTAELVDISKDTRSSFSGTADLYSKLIRSTSELGISQEQLLKITRTVNQSFVAGGASVSETNSSILQLGQALSSGVLQGDELRSLRENAPLLARAIADEFDTTIGGLKELGAEGEITAERVLRAIETAGADIESQFDRTNLTVSQAMTNLETSFTAYIGRVDDATGASAALAGFINNVADNIDDLGQAAVVATAAFAGMAGAKGAMAVVSSLQGIGTWAALSSKSVGLLNVGLRFLGGPVGIAIGTLAGALALMATNGESAAVSMDEILASATELTDQIHTLRVEMETDSARLLEIHEDLEGALKGQAEQAQQTADAELLAINRRIAKNKELLAVYESAQAGNLSRAQKAYEKIERDILKHPDVEKAYRESFNDRLRYNAGIEGGEYTGPGLVDIPFTNKNLNFSSFGLNVPGKSPQDVFIKQERILENTDYGAFLDAQEKADELREKFRRQVRSGKDLNEKDEALLFQPSKLEEAREQLGELKSIMLGSQKALEGDLDVGASSGGSARDLSKSVLSSIDEINRAYLAATETRRQEIARVLQDRLDAIDAEKLAEADAEDAKRKARLVAKTEIEELEKAELQKQRAQLDEVNRLIEARDLHDKNNRLIQAQAEGNTELVSVLEREIAILNEANRLRALGYDTLSDIHELAEKTVNDRLEAERQISDIARDAARTQKDLEDELEIARAAKNEAEIERLEDILDLRRRIGEYEGLGYSKDEATQKAEEQQKEIKKYEDEMTEFQRAFRDAFKDGFKEAIRTGDVEGALRGVLADTISRAWDDALDNIADTLYDVFNSIWDSTFGSGSSAGGNGVGILDTFFSSVLTGGGGSSAGSTGNGSGIASSVVSSGAQKSSFDFTAPISTQSFSKPVQKTSASVTYSPVINASFENADEESARKMVSIMEEQERVFIEEKLPPVIDARLIDNKKHRRI